MPAPAGPVNESTIDAIGRTFTEHYRAAYGIALDAPTEMVNFRVRVTRTVEKLSLRPHDGAPTGRGAVPSGERRVLFSGGRDPRCPVYRWADLEPGMRLPSPSIVEGADTTVVAPPGCHVELDRWRNLVLRQDDGR